MKKLLYTLAALVMTIPALRAQGAPEAEMRSTWIATVWRLDWPQNVITSTGNAAQIQSQKKSLTTMLDSLAANNFNAANLQVRGRADAFYKSSYEPWSSDLVATRGMDPGWDPLEFFVEECHKRGLEAHAWVNPYRYETQRGQWTGTPRAYRDEHPDWLLDDGQVGVIVLNPGLPEVRQRICDITREIVTNYDIDGLLFDDYFYAEGTKMTADADLYNAYKATGGTLSQGDWRRDNVNRMVADVYRTIKEIKPWVRFGVAPAGLTCTSSSVAAKHDVPVCPSGHEYQYDGIYSDPLAWLEQKSLDYMSPQIYWTIGNDNARYDIICKWWSDLMPRYDRHLYVSHSISSLSGASKAPVMHAGGAKGETFDEYSNEIALNRQYDLMDAPGSIFYSAKYLYVNAPLFAHHLRKTVFSRRATMPAMSWEEAPEQGQVKGLVLQGNTLSWTAVDNVRYAVYATSGAQGDPGELIGVTYEPAFTVPAAHANSIIEVAVYDRYGNVHARLAADAPAGQLASAVLTSPAAGQEVNMPCMLTWQPVEGATHYRVDIYADEEMTTPIAFTRVDGGATELSTSSIYGLPDNGTLWWRVVAFGDGMRPSSSALQSMRIHKFGLTWPADGQEDVPLTATVRWSDPDFDAYMEIAKDEAFNDIVYTAAGSGEATVPQYTLAAGTKYWARVTATDNTGATLVADPVSFRTVYVDPRVPEFVHPLHQGVLHSNQAIRVNPAEGVVAFRLMVSDTDGFAPRTSYVSDKISTSTFTDNKTGAEIKVKSKALVDGQTYYARVRASYQTPDNGRQDTDYSPVIEFTYSTAEAGVEDIVADVCNVSIDGLTVTVAGVTGKVTLFDTTGRPAATAVSTANTPVTLTVPAPGLYILVAGPRTTKFTLH